MNQTQDDIDLFDEVEDPVILSSLPGPSIGNFSSQLISRLGINSHHEQRAETATLINSSLGVSSFLNEIVSLKAKRTPPPLPFLSLRKTL